MTTLKTRQTGKSVDAFLKGVEPQRRREDATALKALFDRATGMRAEMWGPAIIGYGRYRFRYESGREGDWFVTGFSPRKQALSLYVMAGAGGAEGAGAGGADDLLARLGKHRRSKACLYINKLADVDLDVLEELIARDVQTKKERYEVEG